MENITAVVADGLSVLGALVSAYLSLGIVLAFLRGQVDAMTNRPAARDITRRIMMLVVCVAFVALAQTVSADIASLAGGSIETAAEMRDAYIRIAQYFLDVAIGAAAVLLAVGVATGFVGAQLAVLAGEALQLSEIVARVLILAALAVGAFLTISVSHIIVGALS
jgi:hypothetical protein